MDAINPAHYREALPNGVEVIDVIEHLGLGPAYCEGNVFKYLFRWRHKNGIEDLRKARWYLDRLIGLLETADEPRLP